ncbi:MAG: LCP family protein [Acidimicrobiales bacterium]|nr:LCP family protein [Acidimicrobiales bacterium]
MLLVIAIVGSIVGYVEFLNHQINRVAVKGLTGASGAERGDINILLVGSTTRCGLKHQNPAFGLCAQVSGVNSDVIMVLHLDPATRKAAILSVPRDVFAPNARSDGPDKVDGALAQGPTQLVHAVEDDFAIPIQHYAELNFDSFMGIVNAIGGVKMYFPMPVYDAYSQLDIKQAGCVALNGFQALAVVRARHLQYKPPGVTTSNHADWPYDPESDLSRIVRDHEFLRVLASTVAKRGLGNPLTDRSLLAAVTPQLQVDSGLTLSGMVQLLLDFHNDNPDSAPQLTLPVIVNQHGSYVYQGTSYGSVEFASQPADTQAIDAFLGVSPSTDTMTGGTLPSPGSVTVSVENGTRASGQAGQTARALQALGYQVVGTGDAQAQSRVAETYVEYSSRVNEPAAERVAHSLSGAVILSRHPTAKGADVTVVTGSSFSVNGAPPSSGKTPSSGKSSSREGAPVSSNAETPAPALSAPTSSNPPLAAFDPRACPA